MTVKEIVKKYLGEHGYDGLCTKDCGCDKDNLFPCAGEGCPDTCVPAYKVGDEYREEEKKICNHIWHIVLTDDFTGYKCRICGVKYGPHARNAE